MKKTVPFIALLVTVLVAVAVRSSAPVSARTQLPQIGGCPGDSARFHPCALAKARTFSPPRTPDGRPDLQGLWDAPTVPGGQTLEEHPGAYGFTKTSSKIIDPSDGKIPYQSWAAAQSRENETGYIDPYAFCVPPGVPRQMYNAGYRQIIQRPDLVLILSERVHVSRTVHMDGSPHPDPGIKLLMGDSRGRWEGNTLVIDVRNLSGRVWYDLRGHFQSDALHVVERLTLIEPNTIHYQATIDDPTLYTRPWTIVLPLRRNLDYSEIWEEACYEGISSTSTISNLRDVGYRVYTGIRPPK